MTVKTITEHVKETFNNEIETLLNIDPAADILYMGTEVELLPRGAGELQQQRLWYVAVLKSNL